MTLVVFYEKNKGTCSIFSIRIIYSSNLFGWIS